MNKLIMNTLVAAGFAAAVPLAFAQANPPAVGQGQHAQQAQHAQHGQRGHHADHGKKAFRMPGERVEARLAYMKTALKITDAQSQQWEAFAGVMRKQAKEADARIQAHREKRAADTERKRMTAIERLELRQQFMARASERIGERLTVQKPLYAALSPEQQQIADRLFAGRGGKHGGRGGRHGRA